MPIFALHFVDYRENWIDYWFLAGTFIDYWFRVYPTETLIPLEIKGIL